MPDVARARTIQATPEAVWNLVSDPHNLPRWWPRTARVEDVQGSGGRRRWTAVLTTERGSGVRADYRATASTHGRRFAWEQDVAGTAFEKVLRSSSVAIEIEPRDEGAQVTLRSSERLRGFARFGSVLMRTAGKRRLDEALDGIELALVGESA